MKQRVNMDLEKSLWKQVSMKAIELDMQKKDLVELALNNFINGGTKMKKYLGTLMAAGSNFDELWSDNLEEIKEWAKGRGQKHDVYTDKFYKYKVSIMINVNETLEPFEDYTEE